MSFLYLHQLINQCTASRWGLRGWPPTSPFRVWTICSGRSKHMHYTAYRETFSYSGSGYTERNMDIIALISRIKYGYFCSYFKDKIWILLQLFQENMDIIADISRIKYEPELLLIKNDYCLSIILSHFKELLLFNDFADVCHKCEKTTNLNKSHWTSLYYSWRFPKIPFTGTLCVKL